MQLRLTFVILAICAVASSLELKSHRHHLSKFVHESRAAIEDNPSRSIECFGAYMDEITEQTNVYEAAHLKCTSDSEAKLTALDETFAGNRNDLTKSAETVCVLLSNCNANVGILDFFKCYSTASSDAYKTSYTIGTSSEKFANDAIQQKAQITYDKNQCDAACKETYEKSADASWTTLQNCINPPPSAPENKSVHAKVMHQSLKKH